MGLILDSSILIAGERRGETVRQMMQRIVGTGGDAECALSAISMIELTQRHLPSQNGRRPFTAPSVR
jgi:hypothetical protein